MKREYYIYIGVSLAVTVVGFYLYNRQVKALQAKYAPTVNALNNVNDALGSLGRTYDNAASVFGHPLQTMEDFFGSMFDFGGNQQNSHGTPGMIY